jgi:hypothetical protein
MTSLTYKNRPCRILGTVGASRPCDCCGNSILEKAVAVLVDDCDVFEIGCVCASKAIFGTARSSAKIKRLASEADHAEKMAVKSDAKSAAARMVHSCECSSRMEHINQALYRHLRTGRPVAARRPWVCGEWAVAVDTSDPADMKRWAGLGFAPRAVQN